MKTNLIFYLTAIVITNFTFAQTEVVSYNKQMKAITKELDSTKFKNNILYDRVYPLAKLDLFNQNQIKDTSNVVHFKQAEHELYLASNKKNQLFNSENLKQTIYHYQAANKVSVGIINADLTIIKKTATDPANLLISSTGNGLAQRMHEMPDKNPYENKQSLVIAILEDVIYQGAKPTVFSIKETFFEKSNNPIENLFVKFDSEQTTQLVTNGNKTIEFSATFKTSGKKIIEFFGNYLNGRPFKTFASIVIKILPSNSSTKCVSDIIKFRADELFTSYESDAPTFPPFYTNIGRDERVEIEYKIFYSGTDCILRKPILIMDGIDYGDERKIQNIYNEVLVQKDVQSENLGDKLRDLGYDVVIANFPIYKIATYNKPLFIGHEPEIVSGSYSREGGSDYIQRNAKGIKQLIKILNSTLTSNSSTEKLVVVGPSMGGLVSRWALKELENEGYNHNTKLWVSFDAPHQGANIPLALQFAAEYNEDLAQMDKLLRPASKQLLVHHFAAGSPATGGAPNFRDRFASELAALCYPINNIKKIALVNGAATAEANYTAGMQIAKIHIWLTSFPYANAAFGELYFSQHSGTNKVFEIRKRDIITWNTTEKYVATNANIGSYDVAPGCKFSLTDRAKIGGYTNPASPNPLFANIFGNIEQYANYFTFMPTKSTLDFKGVSFLLTEPLNNRNLVTTRETPFDAYYTPPTNEEHVELNTANVAWLLNQLNTVSNTNVAQNVICGQRVTSLEIIGNNNLCDEFYRTYQLEPNNLTNISWTVVNLQIISSNNQQIRVRRINPYQASSITATYAGIAGAGNVQTTKALICNRPNLRFAVGFENKLNPFFALNDIINETPLAQQNITAINWEITSGDGQIVNNNSAETEVIGTNFTGTVTVTNDAGETYSKNFFYPNFAQCKAIQKVGFDTYHVIDRCNNNTVVNTISEKEVYTVYGYKLENLPLNNANIEPNLGNPGDVQILHIVTDGEHLTKRIIKE